MGVPAFAARAPMSRFPDMSDGESYDGYYHAAGECSAERRDFEIQKPAPGDTATQAAEDDAPRRGAPPKGKQYADANREAARECVAARRIEIVGEGAELALLLLPTAVAPPPGAQHDRREQHGNLGGPNGGRLRARQHRLFRVL